MTQTLIEKTACKTEPTQQRGGKINLIGLSHDELKALMASLSIEPFRAKQLWHWLYHRGAAEFSAMTNIAKKTQELLLQHCCIERAKVVADQTSSDGTRKWLFEFSDGSQVETVFIPEDDRGTLCISSQVGCTLACTFCHTGTQALLRNLTAAEIIGQVLSAKDALADWQSTNKNQPADHRRITNIVFMGMGEPLFNYGHVARACDLLADGEGIALSRRRITISTSGVVPRIYQMSDELGVNLAISLHAVRDPLRDDIVPINRKYKLAELLEAMRYYHARHPSRRIMVEYVMLQEVNDTPEDAQQLVKLLDGLPVKMNLIPFNPWPGSPYQRSSNNRIHAFGRVLMAANITTPIRRTRGDDILAACGQLKSATQRKKGEKIKRV